MSSRVALWVCGGDEPTLAAAALFPNTATIALRFVGRRFLVTAATNGVLRVFDLQGLELESTSVVPAPLQRLVEVDAHARWTTSVAARGRVDDFSVVTMGEDSLCCLWRCLLTKAEPVVELVWSRGPWSGSALRHLSGVWPVITRQAFGRSSTGAWSIIIHPYPWPFISLR